MGARRLLPAALVADGLVREAKLVLELGQPLLRLLAPGAEVLACGCQEAPQVSPRRLVAPAVPVQQGEVPVRLGPPGVAPQHVL